MSIDARVETTVTPVANNETIKLTVSGIINDLTNGLDREKIATKYGLTKQEVNEVFKHPKLQGLRVKRKAAVRFVLEDDTVSTEPVNPQITDSVTMEPQSEVDPGFVDAFNDADAATPLYKQSFQ
jgi:uncharacterized protein (DUF433 family)